MRAPLGQPSVKAPAVSPTSMANGNSSDTDTSNSGPARAASEANLREHGVRLSKRGRRYCLRRSCEGYGKANSSNQPDHGDPPLKESDLPSAEYCYPWAEH
jgi:hypothetical protein